MSSLNLIPRMSEKAYQQSQDQNTYVFEVPLTANKNEVIKAVTAEYKVTVEDARLLVAKGKKKMAYRKRQRPVAGKRRDVKKAYIRIKSGETIDIFGKLEEAEKNEAKAADIATKATQKAADKAEGKKGGKIRQALSGGRAPRQVQNKGGDK